jgi:hypothetical protein
MKVEQLAVTPITQYIVELAILTANSTGYSTPGRATPVSEVNLKGDNKILDIENKVGEKNAHILPISSLKVEGTNIYAILFTCKAHSVEALIIERIIIIYLKKFSEKIGLKKLFHIFTAIVHMPPFELGSGNVDIPISGKGSRLECPLSCEYTIFIDSFNSFGFSS